MNAGAESNRSLGKQIVGRTINLVVCPDNFRQEPLISFLYIKSFLTVKPKHSLASDMANSCLLMPELFGRAGSELATRELIDRTLIVSLVSSRCSVTDARNKLGLLMKEGVQLVTFFSGASGIYKENMKN